MPKYIHANKYKRKIINMQMVTMTTKYENLNIYMLTNAKTKTNGKIIKFKAQNRIPKKNIPTNTTIRGYLQCVA